MTIEQEYRLKDLIQALRMAAYDCGRLEQEDASDTRPTNKRGSTHELAIVYRKEMEDAQKEINEYIHDICNPDSLVTKKFSSKKTNTKKKVKKS